MLLPTRLLVFSYILSFALWNFGGWRDDFYKVTISEGFAYSCRIFHIALYLNEDLHFGNN